MQNPSYMQIGNNDFRSSILRKLCPTKNFLFGKILMTSFHVICGLGLPQSKILGTPMNWRLPGKNFWRTFFLGERLRLCPWSLALASSIPILGLERFCPRQGCPWPRIFLCPWPWSWPRAMCPRLHLCSTPVFANLLIISGLGF